MSEDNSKTILDYLGEGWNQIQDSPSSKAFQKGPILLAVVGGETMPVWAVLNKCVSLEAARSTLPVDVDSWMIKTSRAVNALYSQLAECMTVDRQTAALESIAASLEKIANRPSRIPMTIDEAKAELGMSPPRDRVEDFPKEFRNTALYGDPPRFAKAGEPAAPQMSDSEARAVVANLMINSDPLSRLRTLPNGEKITLTNAERDELSRLVKTIEDPIALGRAIPDGTYSGEGSPVTFER